MTENLGINKAEHRDKFVDIPPANLSAAKTSLTAYQVIKLSMKVVASHPQLLIYPYTALLFISLTYPLISASFVAHWYDRIFSEADSIAPHRVAFIIGVVGFSAFYTAFVSAYFTTAVSAGVMATLNNKNPSPFYGINKVLANFFRVTKFAVLAIFFFPAGVYAQRSRLPKGWLGVFGSSLTLHMAQVAPSIIGGHARYGTAIRDSVDKLGKTWRVGLELKVGMYIMVFIIFVAPKLIQHHWYKSEAANNIGWLLSIEIGASGYVFFKVINAIFTAVLYHNATKSQS